MNISKEVGHRGDCYRLQVTACALYIVMVNMQSIFPAGALPAMLARLPRLEMVILGHMPKVEGTIPAGIGAA
eukprot:1182667-Amphidinium_carterae.2